MSATPVLRSKWLRLAWIAARVLLLLAVVDYFVATRFVWNRIVPGYVTPYPMLRDRTSGRNTSILFEALERVPNPGVRLAFVGDSTMNSADGADQTFVPFLARTELRQRFPALAIETVDASLLGLYGSSAALFVAKLLSRDVDVIVYGVTPRAFPAHPTDRWVSTVPSELDLVDVENIAVSGATPWLLENLGAENLITGIAKSQWATYAYRTELRKYLAELFGQAPTGPAGPNVASLAPPPASRDRATLRYEWTKDEYGGPNFNWQALEVVGALCATLAPGRCVLYASPINPLLRDRLYEPGLYDDYLANLRVVAGRHGLIYRDYTDALTPADFRVPKYGAFRDPIHMNPQGRAKLARLLLEPLSQAVENTSAFRHLRPAQAAAPGGTAR